MGFELLRLREDIWFGLKSVDKTYIYIYIYIYIYRTLENSTKRLKRNYKRTETVICSSSVDKTQFNFLKQNVLGHIIETLLALIMLIYNFDIKVYY